MSKWTLNSNINNIDIKKYKINNSAGVLETVWLNVDQLILDKSISTTDIKHNINNSAGQLQTTRSGLGPDASGNDRPARMGSTMETSTANNARGLPRRGDLLLAGSTAHRWRPHTRAGGCRSAIGEETVSYLQSHFKGALQSIWKWYLVIISNRWEFNRYPPDTKKTMDNVTVWREWLFLLDLVVLWENNYVILLFLSEYPVNPGYSCNVLFPTLTISVSIYIVTRTEKPNLRIDENQPIFQIKQILCCIYISEYIREPSPELWERNAPFRLLRFFPLSSWYG